MQKRITVFPAFVFACFQTVASSQSANAFQMPDPVPPSPNSAALGKFGDIPVSTYTGIPNVTIPLYEIKSGSITLPVTLNYGELKRLESLRLDTGKLPQAELDRLRLNLSKTLIPEWVTGGSDR